MAQHGAPRVRCLLCARRGASAVHRARGARGVGLVFRCRVLTEPAEQSAASTQGGLGAAPWQAACVCVHLEPLPHSLVPQDVKRAKLGAAGVQRIHHLAREAAAGGLGAALQAGGRKPGAEAASRVVINVRHEPRQLRTDPSAKWQRRWEGRAARWVHKVRAQRGAKAVGSACQGKDDCISCAFLLGHPARVFARGRGLGL